MSIGKWKIFVINLAKFILKPEGMFLRFTTYDEG